MAMDILRRIPDPPAQALTPTRKRSGKSHTRNRMIGTTPQAICPIAVQAGISALAACPAQSVICIACRGGRLAGWPPSSLRLRLWHRHRRGTHSLSLSSNVEMSQRNLTDRCLFLGGCQSRAPFPIMIDREAFCLPSPRPRALSLTTTRVHALDGQELLSVNHSACRHARLSFGCLRYYRGAGTGLERKVSRAASHRSVPFVPPLGKPTSRQECLPRAHSGSAEPTSPRQ